MWFSRYMAIILRMSLQGISSSPAAERSRNNASSAQLLSELSNGDGEIRTLDPLLARQVLSQLSYTPMINTIEIFIKYLNPFPVKGQSQTGSRRVFPLYK